MAGKTLILKRSICASPALVYLSVTNATALREWFCDLAVVQPRMGGRIYCQWNDGLALMGRYTALSPYKKVAFTLRGDEDGDEALVTINLADKEDCVALTLTLSSEGKAWIKRAAQEEARWNTALDNLASVLETGVDRRLEARPSLGIDVASANTADKEGVRVLSVRVDSPAGQAGIQPGDVLLAVGAHKLQGEDSLATALQQRKVGERVKITFARNGSRLNATIALASAAAPNVPEDHEVLAELVARKYTEVNRDLTQALKGTSAPRACQRPASGAPARSWPT